MAYNKDNNADLGNQTIEGTVSPYELEAELVMPDGSTAPLYDAENASTLDEQLATLLNDDTSEPIVAQAVPDDLDEQLAKLMEEQDAAPSSAPTDADLDARLDELLRTETPVNEYQEQQESGANDEPPIILAGDSSVDADDQPIILAGSDPVDAQTDEAIILTPPQSDTTTQEDPIIIAPTAENNNVANDTEAVVTPPPYIPEEQRFEQAQQSYSAAPSVDETREKTDTDAEQARAIMEHAQKLIEQAQAAQAQAQAAQAQAAQAQANAQMQALAQANAQMQAQAVQAAQAQLLHTAPVLQTHNTESAAAAEARVMMQQAQMMMQQAQQAQLQAQHAAQAAQLQAEQAARAAQNTTPVMPVMSSDPYAAKEVDRLKSELDGMRDLVNKLTLQLAQTPGAPAQNVHAPAYAYPDNDSYRKLQSELEGMRREIIEKDLRDREKELERKQKEAENTVKDIRPEMVQMSDSRDVVPVGGGSNVPGGEYIPLANGVYYSTKDKQVYVMTLASGAAANPTIERKAPARKRPAPRPAARHAAPRRRPLGSMHRRPPRGGRPHR